MPGATLAICRRRPSSPVPPPASDGWVRVATGRGSGWTADPGVNFFGQVGRGPESQERIASRRWATSLFWFNRY